MTASRGSQSQFHVVLRHRPPSIPPPSGGGDSVHHQREPPVNEGVVDGAVVVFVDLEDCHEQLLEIDENDNGTIDNTFVDRGFSLIVN